MSFSDCDSKVYSIYFFLITNVFYLIRKDSKLVLITYRSQINAKRLVMHMRTIEGHHEPLQLYITSKIQSRCSMLRRHTIKLLLLHQRSSAAIDPNEYEEKFDLLMK